MERVEHALGVRQALLHAGVDPLGAVAGDCLDGGALLVGRLSEEQVEHLLAVSVVRPGDPSALVVDGHGDVRVPPPSCSRSRPRLSRWDRRTCTASRIPPTGRRPCARYGRPSSTRCAGIRPRSSGWRPPPATRTPSRNPR